ncbi:MAG: hypothetical protein K2W94_02220 [Alphaproteobacteria bacterium]|nr:hypothetical protein [Alphaproteobacteria bacterium]
MQTRFQPDGHAELTASGATSPRVSCTDNDSGYNESSYTSSSASPLTLCNYDEEDSDNDWESEEEVVDKYTQLVEEYEERFLRKQLQTESKIKKKKLLKDNTKRDFLLYGTIHRPRHGRLAKDGTE